MPALVLLLLTLLAWPCQTARLIRRGPAGVGADETSKRFSAPKHSVKRATPLPMDDPVFQEYSSYVNSYYRAPDHILTTTTQTSIDCTKLCAEDELCTHWGWCGDTTCQETSHCDAEQNMEATYGYLTCILSYNSQEGFVAYTATIGSAVTWYGGLYEPGWMNKAAEFKTRQDLVELDPVYELYNSFLNTYARLTAVTKTSTATSMECTQLCSEDPDCIYYAWCDAGDSSAGCQVYSACGDSASESSYPAGTCLLSNMADKARGTMSTADGAAVNWISGYYDPIESSPSGDTGCTVKFPVLQAQYLEYCSNEACAEPCQQTLDALQQPLEGITAGFKDTASMLAGLLDAEQGRRLLSRHLKQEEYDPGLLSGPGVSWVGNTLGGVQRVGGIQECNDICAGSDVCQGWCYTSDVQPVGILEPCTDIDDQGEYINECPGNCQLFSTITGDNTDGDIWDLPVSLCHTPERQGSDPSSDSSATPAVPVGTVGEIAGEERCGCTTDGWSDGVETHSSDLGCVQHQVASGEHYRLCYVGDSTGCSTCPSDQYPGAAFKLCGSEASQIVGCISDGGASSVTSDVGTWLTSVEPLTGGSWDSPSASLPIPDITADEVDEKMGGIYQWVKDVADLVGYDLKEGKFDPNFDGNSAKKATAKFLGGKLVSQINDLAGNFYDIATDAAEGLEGIPAAYTNYFSTMQCVLCCITANVKDLGESGFRGYNCEEDCSRSTMAAVEYKVHISKYLDRCI